jgi:glycosyltransferase involved in cell wall biosynthesis
MKILFLSNFYPPHNIGGFGGYAALCQEVVEGLVERGHDVAVLTSTYGVDHEIVEGYVHRLLSLESDLHFYQTREAWLYPLKRNRNLNHLRSLIERLQPDFVFIWGMWNLSNSLAAEAEKLLGSRVVYYIANPWPIEPNMHQFYWDMPAQTPLRRLAKRLLRIPARLLLKAEWEQVPLLFKHAPCCSQAQRDQLLEAGVPLQDAPIIYEGIDLAPYLAQANRRNGAGGSTSLSLLFVGMVAEHKGIHTIIEALTHLPPAVLKRISLTILGSGHPDYEARLRHMVNTHNLEAYVTFHNPIPRPELPAFLGRFEVLLLPSIWPEPLARIMQEGLAAGMVVVGSATGGTKETITDGENGLLFAAADAVTLAEQIERILNDPPLRQKLAEEGKQTAIEQFDIGRMIDEIERYLKRIGSN